MNAMLVRFWLYEVRRSAYRRFPKLFPDPDFQDRLAIYRSRDEEENVRSLPPDSESIRIRCVWGVEYFLPSQIDELIVSLRKLGWDEEDEVSSIHNPVEWLRHRRRTLSGGGWFNLGRIERPGKKSNIPGHRVAPLPRDISFAVGQLYSITSSISCVVVCFILKEKATEQYEKAIRRTYKTYRKPLKRGYSIVGPERQKKLAVTAARDMLRANVTVWFRENIPGLLSAECSDAGLPICEFQTYKETRPFPAREENSTRTHHFFDLLGVEYDFDAWESLDNPGLKFVWPIAHGLAEKNHAIIAAKESDFGEKQLEYYGGHSGFGMPVYLNKKINVFLSRWALLGVVGRLEHQFAEVRDWASPMNYKKQNALLALRRIGDLFLSCTDTGAAANELARFASDSRYFSHDVAAFAPCRPDYFVEKDPNFSKVIRDSVTRRTALLQESAESVRALLVQQGSAVGTLENVRLQRWMATLTVMILVLTVVAAVKVFRDTTSSDKASIEIRQIKPTFYSEKGAGGNTVTY